MAKKAKKQTTAENKSPGEELAEVVRRTLDTYVDERGMDQLRFLLGLAGS